MIDARCERGEITMKVEGSIDDIMADLLTIIHAIYMELLASDTSYGEAFEFCMKDAFERAFELTNSDLNMLAQRWLQKQEEDTDKEGGDDEE